MNIASKQRQPGLTWYGRPIEELTRDELIAALYALFEYIERHEHMHHQTVEVIRDIYRRSGILEQRYL